MGSARVAINEKIKVEKKTKSNYVNFLKKWQKVLSRFFEDVFRDYVIEKKFFLDAQAMKVISKERIFQAL